jgi:hypothetical protein
MPQPVKQEVQAGSCAASNRQEQGSRPMRRRRLLLLLLLEATATLTCWKQPQQYPHMLLQKQGMQKQGA